MIIAKGCIHPTCVAKISRKHSKSCQTRWNLHLIAIARDRIVDNEYVAGVKISSQVFEEISAYHGLAVAQHNSLNEAGTHGVRLQDLGVNEPTRAKGLPLGSLSSHGLTVDPPTLPWFG